MNIPRHLPPVRFDAGQPPPPRAEQVQDPQDTAALSGQQPVKTGLVKKIVREVSMVVRWAALGVVSPLATLIGVGLGSSPDRLTGAHKLHELGIDGSGVRVAIMDQAFTKFGPGDEDVVGVYDASTKQFSDKLEPANSDIAREVVTGEKHESFHGNAMANIVTGEGWGVKGVAPGAEVIGVNVYDKQRGLTPDLFIDGLQWLVDNHAQENIQVVSISLNYRNPTQEQQDKAQELISRLHDEGVTVVVAAGNRGPKAGTIRFPGTAKDVVCVGSYASGIIPGPWDDRVERHSGRGGNGVPGPHTVGPGGLVFSRDADGVVTLSSGTSNAVPMYAGAIALLAQAFPNVSPDQRVEALEKTCRPITGDPDVEGSGAFSVEAAYDHLAALLPPLQGLGREEQHPDVQ